MEDISDLSLNDFMVAKRKQQNLAGENFDKIGLLTFYDGIAADYDKVSVVIYRYNCCTSALRYFLCYYALI